MRVVINAASAHMGGSVTYLANIMRWLPQVAPDGTFVFHVPEATGEKLGGEAHTNVEVRPYPYASTRGGRRMYFDQVHLPRRARRESADVLFSTTGFGTWWSPCPQVLLIRNLTYFDPAFHAKYRELGRSLTRKTLRRWYSLLSMRRAEAVLFPTRAMQGMVERYLSLDDKATHALHYGFDVDHFQGTADEARGDAVSAPVRHARRLKAQGHPLLLNVSTYAVHKNVETLIEALPRLLQRHPKLRLLTTTSRERTTDTAEYDALQQRARALGVTEAWVELGYVPYEELHALYRTADVYVFPSFTESFGHSMVEAMASGLPVVAAGTAVNREVCGAAGRYFDTFDPEDCAAVLGEVLHDASVRGAMEEASVRRAAHFSWQTYTEQLVEVFRSVQTQR